MDKEAKIQEAIELGNKLFTLANEFAMAGEGDVAVLLHAASNDTRRAKSQLEGALSAAKFSMIIRTEMMVNSVLMGEG